MHLPTRLQILILLIVVTAWRGHVFSAEQNPFAAHNAYPWRLYPKDRFERAVQSGLRHIEIDVTYDPKRACVVATHDSVPTGKESTLTELLAPLWKKWEGATDKGYTLILDFKTSSKDLVEGVRDELSAHEGLLSKMKKGTNDFQPGTVTVCLTGSGAAHAVYDRMIMPGTDYLAFSDDTDQPGNWQESAASYVPDKPAGFVRFITLEKHNFMQGPRDKKDDQVSLDRLKVATRLANQGGYQIRIYTVNPGRKPNNEWNTVYWDACVEAQVHMIATDAYDLAVEYWTQQQSRSAAGAN